MAGEDPGFVAFVRQQQCLMAAHDPCYGPVQAHHAGIDKGMSQRDHDTTCVPLCLKHHRNWHDASGLFKDFCKDERREWATTQIVLIRQRIGEVE